MSAAVARPWPPQVTIEVGRGWSDCEDCGSYDWGHASIELPGRTLRLNHDGHLGGGNWDGDSAALYLWALAALGVRVRVDGAAVCPPYYERQPGESWQEVVLCAEPVESLDIRRELRPLPQDPDYESAVAARWRALDGCERDFRAEEGWDGELASLYRKLLQDRAVLKMSECNEDPYVRRRRA